MHEHRWAKKLTRHSAFKKAIENVDLQHTNSALENWNSRFLLNIQHCQIFFLDTWHSDPLYNICVEINLLFPWCLMRSNIIEYTCVVSEQTDRRRDRLTFFMMPLLAPCSWLCLMRSNITEYNWVVSEQTDIRMEGRTDGRLDGRTDRRTDGKTDGRTYFFHNASVSTMLMAVLKEVQYNRIHLSGIWTDRQTDGRTDGQTDGRTRGRLDLLFSWCLC